MRLKIILPNVIIVLIVGLLSYFIVRGQLSKGEDSNAAKVAVDRGAQGAAGLLQLQFVTAERWLAENAANSSILKTRLSNPSLDDPASRTATQSALADLLQRASQSGLFRAAPSIAGIIDAQGLARGTSQGTAFWQGDEFPKSLSTFMQAMKDDRSGTELWMNVSNLKHFVSYAPVHDADNKVIGAVVMGWQVIDQSIADLADGAAVLVSIEKKDPKVKAKSNEGAASGVVADIEGGALKDMVVNAAAKGNDSATGTGGLVAAAWDLKNVGDGHSAVVVVARRASNASDRAWEILWPIFAATGLGIVFVLIAGVLIGAYVTDPVGKMEESLLQVINGNTNTRIQIEHAELGGLAFRINQLLNTVLGVEEDTTDAEGRPSSPPEPTHFQEAMAVDDRSSEADAAALAKEPEKDYYARLYREYIDAKRANGEAVDGITQDVFTTRIQGMERDASAKFGRPVRYSVQRRDKQVVLLAIPIG